MVTGPREGDPRWPRRLYGVGSDPDPRFTLANERTFLAWIRTSLALMASGVGVESLNAVATPSPLRTVLAVVLLLSGVLAAVTAFTRWFRTERALRRGVSLPPFQLAPVLGCGLALVGVAALVLLLVTGI
ncbi:YidH family protein [Saccharopolyspora rectivirgula]|jgi:putative membrane protein|uniref:Membrane protein n=1 Tax=Saccharopolyspora rectivirgula TaxID=28042 RepID=A0A073B6B0_9PSEU|nr:DUF202 domain-containing protein [Saccharopolyspora rectivirgula]KEI43159.1 membrane protein [Saccharopolyspora rectivirgula]